MPDHRKMFDRHGLGPMQRLESTANEIFQLAKLGYAAQESPVNMADPDSAMEALFEVMGRLAEEIRAEVYVIDEVAPDIGDVIKDALARADNRRTVQ